MVLTLPWTKTLQHKNDIVTLPIADVPDSVLNLVEIYKDFVTMFPLPSKMPAFAIAGSGKLLVLTQQTYIDILKYYLDKLGIPADAFSSHSVRRGSASTMFQSGLSQQHIKMHGTWRSQCFERYISVKHQDKILPSLKMVRFINSNYGDTQ